MPLNGLAATKCGLDMRKSRKKFKNIGFKEKVPVNDVSCAMVFVVSYPGRSPSLNIVRQRQ